jgi:hypothetical protein
MTTPADDAPIAEWVRWMYPPRPKRSAANRALAQRNPLLAGWEHYQAPYLYFESLRRGVPPSRLDFGMRFSAYRARRHLVSRYAFAIPDAAALEAIARYGPILQLGAGTGYWAWLLRRDGVDILPVDLCPPSGGQNEWFTMRHEFVPVHVGDVNVAAAHPERALFLCWPPMTEMAADALHHYRGDHVIYIGEGTGGCTASEAFFATLERDWREAMTVAIPQWDGIHDYLTVYQRAANTLGQSDRSG